MRPPAPVVLAVTVIVATALAASDAQAQPDVFVQAVRELAAAAAPSNPSRTSAIRTAADRMRVALTTWDRHIRTLQDRMEREGAGASAARSFQLHVELAVAYRTRGRLIDAVREFDAAIAVQPSASDVQLLRALTLEAMDRPDEAVRGFRSAWSLDTRNPIKAYYVVGSRESGIGSRESRVDVQRDHARAVLTETYQRLGIDAPRRSSPPFPVLDVISDGLSRTPVVADGAMARVFTLLRASQHDDAIDALAQATRADETKPEDSALAHFARGQRDETENRVAEARREYQAALHGALVGRSVLYVAIARLAQVEGELAAAIEAFARAARLAPNDPNVHKELASAYAADNHPDDAFAELMAALLIDPRDAQAHAAIGQLSLDGGRNADAVTAFNRALELKPERYETHYPLATALTRLGRTEEAARELESFDRARRDALDRRRRDIANDVDREEAVRRTLSSQDGVR